MSLSAVLFLLSTTYQSKRLQLNNQQSHSLRQNASYDYQDDAVKAHAALKQKRSVERLSCLEGEHGWFETILVFFRYFFLMKVNEGFWEISITPAGSFVVEF